MTVKLDIEGFVTDYCRGVKDKDLLARHNINPKELIGIVRKLINDGFITKEQYFDRNRLIHELEAREEKDFLKSLYHCPVCSHIHPSPFTICPACGTDVTKETKSDDEKGQPQQEPSQPAEDEAPKKAEVEVVNTPPAQAVLEPTPAAAAVRTDHEPAAAESTYEEEQLPKFLEDIIEAQLESVFPIGEASAGIAAGSYDIVEPICHSATSSMFRALDSSGQGPDLSVKVFHVDSLSEELIPELLNTLMAYQSTMQDRNILKVLGLATVDGRSVLIYEHMPTTLESLLIPHPEGIPLDLMMEILPQILNSVGYSHMHRGTDGVARRLPHMSLRPEKFMFDPDTMTVKLDECALWKSLVEVRGFMRHMWEEPNVKPEVLAPECFVLDSKFVNAFSADIYALGSALYRLATGKWPFTGSKIEDYHFAHLKTFAVPPRVHRWQIPGWLDKMILKCIEKEPSRRWRSATQMELAIGKGTD